MTIHQPLPDGLFAFDLLRAYDLTKPEDVNTRRIRVRKDRGAPRISLIDFGQPIQMRLLVGRYVVVGKERR